MKIFSAYLAHETNSFSPIATTLDSFAELGVHRLSYGETSDRGVLKGASHFYEEAKRRGDEIHVGLCAHAQPSQPSNRATYETLRSWLLEDLQATGNNLDMVLIFMHGSMMAEGYDDCEGDTLQRIREVVGPDVPIGVLLDLHCNITRQMLDNATVILACKEYPHTDFRQRALEVYDICARTRNGEVSPTTGFVRVPMLGLFQTARPPMRPFIDSIIQRESLPGVLSITLGHGFPWSDFSGASASVLVVTDRQQELANTLAVQLAADFFALRESGQAALYSIDQALDAALAEPEGTVVIADMSDNPGGGAGSDSTFILQRLLERGIENAAIAYLWDPAAVEQAFAAGENQVIKLEIGGKIGPGSGEPVQLEARILKLGSDANQAHIADGTLTHLGRTALISSRGIEIALNDIRQQPFTPSGLVECGLDPWSRKILVLKSSHHFYAGFHQQAARIIYCDAPGTLNSDIARLPYQHVSRPIWPLDSVDPKELGLAS
ncbi:MAG TPA: M81 family metallopeptidase [Xanthomonadales bacterium]|nr:M81 family metallopeptidase [Xanthomonadales bacterium]